MNHEWMFGWNGIGNIACRNWKLKLSYYVSLPQGSVSLRFCNKKTISRYHVPRGL